MEDMFHQATSQLQMGDTSHRGVKGSHRPLSFLLITDQDTNKERSLTNPLPICFLQASSNQGNPQEPPKQRTTHLGQISPQQYLPTTSHPFLNPKPHSSPRQPLHNQPPRPPECGKSQWTVSSKKPTLSP